MTMPRASRNSARARFQRHWTRPQPGGGKPVSSWDGSTHFIELPPVIAAEAGANYVDVELECWVDSWVADYQSLFNMSKATTWEGQSFVLQRNANIDAMNFATSNGTTSTQNNLQAAWGLFGGWVTVRGIKEPAAPGMTLFINGVDVGQDSQGTWDLETDMTNVRIGQGPGALARHWTGAIRNVKIRNSGGTVIHDWPINEGTGTVINDNRGAFGMFAGTGTGARSFALFESGNPVNWDWKQEYELSCDFYTDFATNFDGTTRVNVFGNVITGSEAINVYNSGGYRLELRLAGSNYTSASVFEDNTKYNIRVTRDAGGYHRGYVDDDLVVEGQGGVNSYSQSLYLGRTTGSSIMKGRCPENVRCTDRLGVQYHWKVTDSVGSNIIIDSNGNHNGLVTGDVDNFWGSPGTLQGSEATFWV